MHGLYRLRAIELASAIEHKPQLLMSALQFMTLQFMTGSSAVDMVHAKGFSATSGRMSNWLFPLFNNEAIAKWATTNSDGGFDVSSVCTGARIGIDLGPDASEDTAKIINSLIRQRIYVRLRDRGDNWRAIQGETPVVILWDEIQLGFNSNDADKVSVVRSGGGTFIAATQSVSSVIKRLGKEPADAMLGNFVSAICLKSSDGPTLDLMSQRGGVVLRPVSSIHHIDDEIHGVNLDIGIASEYMAPRDVGGRIAGNPSDIHKRSIRQNLVRQVTDSGDEEVIHRAKNVTGIIGNSARATHLAVTSDELNQYLNERFVAYATIYRAGVMRCDFINVQPE